MLHVSAAQQLLASQESLCSTVQTSSFLLFVWSENPPPPIKLAGSLSWLHEPPPRQSDPVNTLTTLTLILSYHVPLSLQAKCCIRFTRQLVTHVWVAPLIRSSNTLTQQLTRRIRQGVERLAGECSSDTSVATIRTNYGDTRKSSNLHWTQLRVFWAVSIIPETGLCLGPEPM